MWIIRLAVLAAALALPGARAEPRIPGMDAELEASMARGDYVFVWDLDMKTIGRGDPYRTARTYYDGLMYALTEARRLIEPGTPAHLELHPAPPVSGWDESYAGMLASRETYLDAEPVVLHAEVTRRDCDTHRAQVFFAISLKPRDHPAWQAMRRARAATSCDPARN
jgi:hypothetical protein